MNHIKLLYIIFFTNVFAMKLCFYQSISIFLINFVSRTFVRNLVPLLEVFSYLPRMMSTRVLHTNS